MNKDDLQLMVQLIRELPYVSVEHIQYELKQKITDHLIQLMDQAYYRHGSNRTYLEQIRQLERIKQLIE